MELGGGVVIGFELQEPEVELLVELGKARVTVNSFGFSDAACRRFLERGANLATDSSWSLEQVKALCEIGRDRITVLQLMAKHELVFLARTYGVRVAGRAARSLSYQDLASIIMRGGSCTIGSWLDDHDVDRLVGYGLLGDDARRTTTVIVSGVEKEALKRYVIYGKAGLVMDASLSPEEVGDLIQYTGARAQR